MRSLLGFILALLFVFGACKQSTPDLNSEKTQITPQIETNTLMHTVYVWLKEDLDQTSIDKFEAAAQTLANIRSVSKLRMGKPALTEARDVVDQTYSYAMNIEFKDIAAQDAYQIDPIHLSFVENCKNMWTKVIVYDNMMTAY